jgi:LPS sulfotransferase NodH
MKKFLIFADGRTGSSNLGKILRELHGKMFFEPFNNKYNYRNQGADCVENFVRDFNVGNYIGVKHISAQISELFNLRLINKFEKIVFLYRENVLQQAVSWAISERVGNWYKKEEIMRDLRKAKGVSYNHIMQLVSSIIGRREIYKGYFEKNNFLVVKYEDLYNGKLTELNRILDYLEAPRYDLKNEEVNKYLFKSKIHSKDTYSIVKCYEELKSIGSDAIGYLE